MQDKETNVVKLSESNNFEFRIFTSAYCNLRISNLSFSLVCLFYGSVTKINSNPSRLYKEFGVETYLQNQRIVS